MKKLLIIIITILLTLSTYLAASHTIIFSNNLYEKNIDEDAQQYTAQLLEYYQGDNEIPEIFNENEASHLEDVKDLMKKGTNILLISIIALITLFSFTNKQEIKKTLLYSGILNLVLPLPFIFLSFQSTFLKFHQLFFPQGNFNFPLNSTLIQFYPESFFIAAATQIIIIITLISIVLIILGLLDLPREQ